MMQKPLNYADDLADHDVVEDDSELLLGPPPTKLAMCGVPAVVPGWKLGSSSSFKDTSILGSAPVMAKLAQAISVPTQPLLSSRSLVTDNYVYAGGNPVIATCSGAPRKPRTSAPSGVTCTAAESAAASRSYHGGMAKPKEAPAPHDGAEPRVQGDILGGDSEAPSTRPKSGLRQCFSSGRNLLSGSRPPSAKPDGVDVAAPKGLDSQATRPPIQPCTAPRHAALPCVDVDPERRQLLRKLSVLDGPAVPVSSAPTTSNGASGTGPPPHTVEQRGAPAEPATPLREPLAKGQEQAPAQAGAGVGGAAAGNQAPAVSERPPSPFRRLSRMLSGSIVSPGASTTDQRDQDGAGANKGRSAGTAIRELFSRPSSARRKSEAGVAGVQQQPRIEAWKHQRPAAPDTDDGPEGDRVQEFGTEVVVKRPSSGILKRAASALSAALAR